jgi:glucuronate isomerase
MADDLLTWDLYTEICRIPLIDPHSHIDPRRPTARNLDDILNYHYYTELAHSAGMDHRALHPEMPPRERVRILLTYLERFDNTAQYSWLLGIARAFLRFYGTRLNAAQSDRLYDEAERIFSQPDWEEQVFRHTNLEKIFLTNDFDDPLDDFDTQRYVPCLRTDPLVFHLEQPEVRQRLAQRTGIEVGDGPSLRRALATLFEHFTRHSARACAISLPPDFTPAPVEEQTPLHLNDSSPEARTRRARLAFWMLAELCRDFDLPFDLMLGVCRNVYAAGVPQGRDLFDQRTSLIQYAPLFNAFPQVTFCLSVLSSAQNQELVSYSWIFPNVVTSGHWWYSNIPAYIESDLRARLQAVPKIKQIGYYSDAYKLEFVLPKYNMYRKVLARLLADEYVRPGIYTEGQALEMARLLLRDNIQRIFKV